jgi:hypothetical protein
VDDDDGLVDLTRSDEGLDPVHVDVIAQPRRRRRRRARVPKNMRHLLEEAEKRAHARPAAPGIFLKPEKGDGDVFSYGSPYVERRDWEVMLADAFGTRSIATIQAFVDQILCLCRKRWDDDAHAWIRDEGELNQCLNIINGVKPSNEAEAALAVNMCSTYLMQTRIAGRALSSGWVDPKDAYPVAALARAYAHLYDSLNRGRGKGRTTEQKIEVRYERHNHEHQHVHFEGGAANPGHQPHAAPAGTGTENPEGGAALPSPEPIGQVVRLPSRARKARVSNARG